MIESQVGTQDSDLEMITLDCSEYLDNTICHLTDSEIDRVYSSFNIEEKAKWEYRYALRKFFFKDGTFIEFSLIEFKKVVLIYSKAIQYVIKTYNERIKNGKELNIEALIHDTIFPTSYQAHFLFASEIIGAGVKIVSIVLKFGSERKNFDNVVNKQQIDEDFYTHTKIANFFGYEISAINKNDT